MNNLELLDAEIKQLDAKQVSAHPEWDEIQARLEKFRIRRDSQLAASRHLLEIHGVKCFPRGDLIALSGKEKCGKTTACRILATAILRGEYQGIKALESNLRVLWIDTEQAAISSRSVIRGIDMMCGFEPSDDQLFFLNLREWGEKESMIQVLQFMFNDFRPDFVILDGIRDFIHDFNDIRESADIVLEVMRLSSGVNEALAKEQKLNERLPCSVACILHQNKPKDDNNMRGHLGTELANKSGEVWESTRDEDGLFNFTQTRSRTRQVDESVSFKVLSQNYTDTFGKEEEIGIPQIWNKLSTDVIAPIVIHTKNHGDFERTEINMQWLFWNVMRNRGFKWNELMRLMCDLYGLNWMEVTSIRNAITANLVKDDVDLLWHYQGPTFEEPGEGS